MKTSGCSLVEVTLATALVAFALVAILGALPTGLQTVQAAAAQEVTASIAQRTQATLQQLSFAANAAATVTTLHNLPSKSVYYTAEGVEAADPAADARSDAYYRATFACGDPIYPGSTINSTPAPTGWLPSGQTVTLTLDYPQAGTTPGAKKLVYSFLIARQRLD